MEQNVVIAVQLKQVRAEAFTHLYIECRRGLDPCVVHPELDEHMEDEGPGTELTNRLLDCQMVSHRQSRVTPVFPQHAQGQPGKLPYGCSCHLRRRTSLALKSADSWNVGDRIRATANPIANGEKQLHRLFLVGVASLGDFFSISNNVWVVGIYEPGR